MPTLAEFLVPLETTTAKLRGKDLPLRAVLGWESAALERQFPQPYAANDVEEATEQHQEKKKRYECVRRAMQVAIAAGLTNAKGEAWDKDRPRQWVSDFADELWAHLTEHEIVRLWVTVANIGLVDPRDAKPKTEAEHIGTDEVQGNSSAPR